jgi:serine/threonine protein phosphatase PrpC
MIAMSRSIGDASIPGMLHMPDFHELLLSEKDRCVVIGCDGLWDDIDFLSTGKTLLRSNPTMESARLLSNQVFSHGSKDNHLNHRHRLVIVNSVICIQKCHLCFKKLRKLSLIL